MNDRGDDSGSGSVLAIGIIGSTVAALALGIPLYTGLSLRQSVATAADASALAAADVAAGVFPGSPCTIARDVARANRAELSGCAIDGLVVTVRANVRFLGFSLASSATAGPPVVVTN